MQSKKVKVDVKSITSKFGTSRIDNEGYWVIKSGKEGNYGKKLHRLIYEDYYKVSLLPNGVIHHKDGNKLNNRYDNLELMTASEHSRFHALNRSVETCRKISESKKGTKLSDERKAEISKQTKGKNNPMYGKNHSEEAKRKMRESAKNRPPFSEDYKLNKSKQKSSSGYFRVTINNRYSTPTYIYQYFNEDKKRVSIRAKSIDDLKKKVLEKNLLWKKF